jgi:hypothetical protein
MRTKKTVVILLAGKAGNGKTTVAEMLEQKLGEGELTTFRYSFAGPIKYMAIAFMGWDKNKDEKGRKLLQDIGKVGREYDPNIWVKHLLNQMDKKAGIMPFNFVIVDDWRFLNERDYLVQNPLLDVFSVRIHGRKAELPGETGKDVSENSLPEAEMDEMNLYNFVLDNSQDGVELLNEAVEVLADTISRKFILE